MVRGMCGIAVVAFMLPAAAAAQADTTRPFVRGGVYDKPFLAELLGRAAIGGYAEVHARLVRVDGVTEEQGFEARRFNLFTATQVSDVVRIGAELEIEEGGEEIRLEFAAIDFSVHPSFRLRGGMLLSPVGRFNLAHDSPLNEFTDRPLVSTEMLGTALSEPGFGAFGVVPVGGRGRITYEVYAVNGFGDGLVEASPDGTRVPLGRGNFEDNNDAPSLTGRVAWSPSLGFEIGVSGHHGPYNVYRVEGVDVDERRDLTITVLDGEASVAGWRAAWELAGVRVDIPASLAGVYAERQRGAYLEVLRDVGRGLVRTMPSSYFTIGVRLDAVDFDTDLPGDDVRQVTLGFNFRPTAESVLKLGYVRGRAHDRFNNPADHAGLQFSLATYF